MEWQFRSLENIFLMPEPTILVNLRKRDDADSREFVALYDRLKLLVDTKFIRPLSKAEHEEIGLLRAQVRSAMAQWLEKR
jgi:hypothetical protein